MNFHHKKVKVKFSIDRGGTFTDVYAEYAENKSAFIKLLSEDPQNYQDAPLEGIKRILAHIGQDSSEPLDPAAIEWVRMGTTIATNSLLERKGERVGLLTNKGFADILQIGYQERPDIFDLKISKPSLLYEIAVEVNERIRPALPCEAKNETIAGINGKDYLILQKPDPDEVKEKLNLLLELGIKNIAVVFLHSYAFPAHELMVGNMAREMGFSQVSLSCQVMPMIKIVPRGDTTVVDAYLTPQIRQYLQSFQQGFKIPFKENKLLFMQSDGGLSTAANFRGSNAILSGPAGGVVGYAMTAFSKIHQKAVIGFDMGGTSTDVSRFDGEYDLVHETETAGVRMQAPQLNINTVAAGGGSRLFFINNMFVVGPESVGAHPGPVCYRKNGHLAITDANLVLGRLNPGYFPKIFGPAENLPLDLQASQDEFGKITKQINAAYTKMGRPEMTVEQVALGFIEVANQTMARPIKEISVMRGFDIKEHILASFGGAGGQHACAIARLIGIKKIFIHRYSGILSAYGIGLADVVVERQQPSSLTYSTDNLPALQKHLDKLSSQVKKELTKQGFQQADIVVKRYLHMRYQGTSNSYMVKESATDFGSTFRNTHIREFGFDLATRDIIVDDLRVRGCGKTKVNNRSQIAKHQAAPPIEYTSCFFNGEWLKTPIFLLDDLGAGFSLEGPAMIINDISTIIIEPACKMEITKFGDIAIELMSTKQLNVSDQLDPVQLSIFANLFMSIAEQMGKSLQRTAISTNIKERLDYSCAIFDRNGDLVANAPHIPVHLGSMSSAVKRQIEINRDNIQPGDIFLSNHPAAGGSHLPDLTIITPIWLDQEIIFYTAARGHHADIGGSTPGSMPPFSKRLEEEGAAIMTFKIVENEKFQDDKLREILKTSRKIEDNISDLKAQISASLKGKALLLEMVENYGLNTVSAYMGHIQKCAEEAVRSLLKGIARKHNLETGSQLQAIDYMDDGTPIKLLVSIDPHTGNAVFDFSGTGPEVEANWNCPEAVVYSAILYSLRCMIDSELPLNHGCLLPIKVIVPPASLLSPSENCAVAGGNVLTSQRIVDVILAAFQAAAASQGCMNNLTFGNKNFGYYETIGGGVGAGPDWHGPSGTHTHMTNTRITDPEILENRFPVILREFSIRKGSGGAGQFNGGDGLVREIESLAELSGAILSERRVYQPYGLAGGAAGKIGQNTLIKANGDSEDIGGKNIMYLKPGDRLNIKTPGGGGYGPPSNK